jgi:hypothetical protein
VVLQREFPASVRSRSVGAWSGRVREAGEAGASEGRLSVVPAKILPVREIRAERRD